MSREITVTSSMTALKRDSSGVILVDEKKSATVINDMSGTKGPTPASILAALPAAGGTQVDLSGLTQPTWCWIFNQGPADGSLATAAEYVTIGIWNAQDTSFHPMLELGAGEGHPIKLSRNIQEVVQGPGSGTSGARETARLMLLANSKAQNVYVGALEK